MVQLIPDASAVLPLTLRTDLNHDLELLCDPKFFQIKILQCQKGQLLVKEKMLVTSIFSFTLYVFKSSS